MSKWLEDFLLSLQSRCCNDDKVIWQCSRWKKLKISAMTSSDTQIFFLMLAWAKLLKRLKKKDFSRFVSICCDRKFFWREFEIDVCGGGKIFRGEGRFETVWGTRKINEKYFSWNILKSLKLKNYFLKKSVRLLRNLS